MAFCLPRQPQPISEQHSLVSWRFIGPGTVSLPHFYPWFIISSPFEHRQIRFGYIMSSAALQEWHKVTHWAEMWNCLRKQLLGDHVSGWHVFVQGESHVEIIHIMLHPVFKTLYFSPTWWQSFFAALPNAAGGLSFYEGFCCPAKFNSLLHHRNSLLLFFSFCQLSSLSTTSPVYLRSHFNSSLSFSSSAWPSISVPGLYYNQYNAEKYLNKVWIMVYVWPLLISIFVCKNTRCKIDKTVFFQFYHNPNLSSRLNPTPVLLFTVLHFGYTDKNERNY